MKPSILTRIPVSARSKNRDVSLRRATVAASATVRLGALHRPCWPPVLTQQRRSCAHRCRGGTAISRSRGVRPDGRRGRFSAQVASSEAQLGKVAPTKVAASPGRLLIQTAAPAAARRRLKKARCVRTPSRCPRCVLRFAGAVRAGGSRRRWAAFLSDLRFCTTERHHYDAGRRVGRGQRARADRGGHRNGGAA